MTSSLVGSEMCIRDRFYVDDTLRLSFGAAVDFAPANKTDGVYGNLAPVSYTHLTLPTICSV
eukprot:6008623-Prorocentrum_lima.AAC.1